MNGKILAQQTGQKRGRNCYEKSKKNQPQRGVKRVLNILEYLAEIIPTADSQTRAKRKKQYRRNAHCWGKETRIIERMQVDILIYLLVGRTPGDKPMKCPPFRELAPCEHPFDQRIADVHEINACHNPK